MEVTEVDQLEQWIDAATYEDLLRKWRYAPPGSPYLTGLVGEHFQRVMAEKRRAVGAAEAVAASKRIGWDG